MVNPSTLAELLAQTAMKARTNSDRLESQESFIRAQGDRVLVGYDNAHLSFKESGEVTIVCLIDDTIREIPMQLIWDKLFPKESAAHPLD